MRADAPVRIGVVGSRYFRSGGVGGSCGNREQGRRNLSREVFVGDGNGLPGAARSELGAVRAPLLTTHSTGNLRTQPVPVVPVSRIHAPPALPATGPLALKAVLDDPEPGVPCAGTPRHRSENIPRNHAFRLRRRSDNVTHK